MRSDGGVEEEREGGGEAEVGEDDGAHGDQHLPYPALLSLPS